MSYKIVSDSSSNMFALDGATYETVPMKIVAGEKEYNDTPSLNVRTMVNDLKNYKGKSGSSCPNVQEWLDAFQGADHIFGITISKNLSGSFNAAQQAAQDFTAEHPGKKIFILDTLSAGPQQALIIEKLRDLIREGLDFETIKERILKYHNHTHILFCLESLTNLARNGRISPAVAKIAGVLNMRIVGDAKGGQITPVHKPRGDKKALETLLDMMKERGLQDGAKVRVAHCYAEEKAQALKKLVLEHFPNCSFTIEPTAALCSFYAEAGGLMIGFEGGYNTNNNNKDF